MGQLSKELKEIERLEADRRDLFARIDALERQKKKESPAPPAAQPSTVSADMSKNLADLNMKQKLEIGNLRSENEKLMKANHDISREKAEVNDKLVQAKVSLREAETELKASQSKLSDTCDSTAKLKERVEPLQLEVQRLQRTEGELKVEITKLRKEQVVASDKESKMQKDLGRIEKEKKESIQKVQTMHNEIRDLKSKLQEYESGKSANVKKLEDSLTGLNTNSIFSVSFLFKKIIVGETLVSSVPPSNSLVSVLDP